MYNVKNVEKLNKNKARKAACMISFNKCTKNTISPKLK